MELTDAIKYAALAGAMLGGFAASSLFLWRVLTERLGSPGAALMPRVDALHEDLKIELEKVRAEVDMKLDRLLRRCDRIESRIDGLYQSLNN
jgi:hypothetical protein